MARSAVLVGALCAVLGAACASRGPDAPAGAAFVGEPFVELPGVSRVTAFAWEGQGADASLVVAGTRGARVLDAEGGIVREVAYQTQDGDCAGFSHVEPHDLDGDGRLELVARGGGWQPTARMAADGRVLWVHAPEAAPNWMTPGDLDGDGVVDFVVGHNGDGGVRRLDAQGAELWRMPDGNVWAVELFDVDDDGRLEILHTNAGGFFTVRDADGRVLDEFETGHYASRFVLLPGGRILQHATDRFRIVDVAGTWLQDLATSAAAGFADVRAQEVSLGDAGSVLAVLGSQRGADVSVLHVFAPSGARLHEEVLEETCSALTGAPDPAGGEALLVGCGERVWRYRLARAGESAPPTRSLADYLGGGDVFGPLRLGDPPDTVERRLSLLPLTSCRGPACRPAVSWSGGTELTIVPVYEEERLAGVVVFANPTLERADDPRLAAGWEALRARAVEVYGPPDEAHPLPAGPELAETAVTHRWHFAWGGVELGIRARDDGTGYTPALIASPGVRGEDVPAADAAP